MSWSPFAVQESKTNFREKNSNIPHTTALSYVEGHFQLLEAVCYHFETFI